MFIFIRTILGFDHMDANRVVALADALSFCHLLLDFLIIFFVIDCVVQRSVTSISCQICRFHNPFFTKFFYVPLERTFGNAQLLSPLLEGVINPNFVIIFDAILTSRYPVMQFFQKKIASGSVNLQHLMLQIGENFFSLLSIRGII